MATDEALMIDVQKGSRGAFEALFARYRDPLWRFFRRRTSDAGRAEELTQDTFLALLEGAGRYEQRGTFRAFLFGIAYNILHADSRRSAVRAAARLDLDPAVDPPDPTSVLWIRDAIATLDADDRELLMLREYEQLSYQEIAAVRQTPLNTVRSQLFRARMALKAALETPAPQAVRTTHARR